MSDKELADKVVALGVGYLGDDPGGYWNSTDESIADYLNADQFESDWRVAGALMEKVDTVIASRHMGQPQVEATMHGLAWVEPTRNESLPRAIIEACVAALAETDAALKGINAYPNTLRDLGKGGDDESI